MSKGLEALERLGKFRNEDGMFAFQSKDYFFIEKELKDFEWLKSKVSIEWFDKLSSDDKIRFMQIMGWKYE